jgi:hypothetical protein
MSSTVPEPSTLTVTPIVVRTHTPRQDTANSEPLPVFFGHVFFPFAIGDKHAASQQLLFCAHIYEGVKLSPGSSQLPPDVLQDIFSNQLQEMNIDAAVFSSTSFPSWFSIEIPDFPEYVPRFYF